MSPLDEPRLSPGGVWPHCSDTVTTLHSSQLRTGLSESAEMHPTNRAFTSPPCPRLDFSGGTRNHGNVRAEPVCFNRAEHPVKLCGRPWPRSVDLLSARLKWRWANIEWLSSDRLWSRPRRKPCTDMLGCLLGGSAETTPSGRHCARSPTTAANGHETSVRTMNSPTIGDRRPTWPPRPRHAMVIGSRRPAYRVRRECPRAPEYKHGA